MVSTRDRRVKKVALLVAVVAAGTALGAWVGQAILPAAPGGGATATASGPGEIVDLKPFFGTPSAPAAAASGTPAQPNDPGQQPLGGQGTGAQPGNGQPGTGAGTGTGTGTGTGGPPPQPPLPGTPTGVTVNVARENGQTLDVQVRWAVPDGNGSTVTGHEVIVRTDRGSSTGGTVGAGGSVSYNGISCAGSYCDGLRVTAEIRAITSAGKGPAGSGGVTYSAPFTVPRELRRDVSGSSQSHVYENAQGTLPGLHSQILAAGVGCNGWNERVISVYACPDGSCYVYAGVVSAVCKY